MRTLARERRTQMLAAPQPRHRRVGGYPTEDRRHQEGCPPCRRHAPNRERRKRKQHGAGRGAQDARATKVRHPRMPAARGGPPCRAACCTPRSAGRARERRRRHPRRSAACGTFDVSRTPRCRGRGPRGMRTRHSATTGEPPRVADVPPSRRQTPAPVRSEECVEEPRRAIQAVT